MPLVFSLTVIGRAEVTQWGLNTSFAKNKNIRGDKRVKEKRVDVTLFPTSFSTSHPGERSSAGFLA